MTFRNYLKRKSMKKRTIKKKGGFLRELFSSNCNITSKAPTCEPSTNEAGCSQYNSISQIQQQGRSDDQYGSNSKEVTAAPDSTNVACNGQDPTTCSNTNYQNSQDSYNQSRSSTSGYRTGGRRKKKKSLKRRNKNKK